MRHLCYSKIICIAILIALLTSYSNASNEIFNSNKDQGCYFFKSPLPIVQSEPYYTNVFCATENGIQTMSAKNMYSGDDSIVRFSLNPTGINFAVIKNTKKGETFLEIYSSKIENFRIFKFNNKTYGKPLAATFTPDARQLAVATNSATYLLDAKTFKVVEEFPAFTNNPDMLIFSNNSYYLTAAGSGKVIVMNFEDKTVRRAIDLEEEVTDVVFSPDNTQMAILTADGVAEIYDTHSFNIKLTLDDLDKGIACDFSANGKYLAIIDSDHEIKIFNTLKPESPAKFSISPAITLSDINFIIDSANSDLIAYSSNKGVFANRIKLEPYYTKLISDEVDLMMADWIKKMPEESMEQYRLRVNEDTRKRQRQLFEDEISTRIAGNLADMASISLGQYDADNQLLEINFTNMPSVFLQMPKSDLRNIHSSDDLLISETQYGLLADDNFELIYAKFTNKNTGEEYIYDNKNRIPMNFIQNDNIVSLELVQQQMMEEVKLQEIRNQVVAEAKKDNIISDHTEITVDSQLIPRYDANGNKIVNYSVKFNYQVDPEFSAHEDFALGKYRAEESGAASAMLNIVKNALEGEFRNYVKEGRKVEITISGTADATPIVHTIAYDGSLGEIVDEPVYQDDIFSTLSVSKKEGINSNEQLAFLRAYGVKEFLNSNVEGIKDMNTKYSYKIGVSKDKGSEYRRITVEFEFVDALLN